MRNWLAIGSLMLVAGSWLLWTPQQLFPRVPLLASALRWSDQVDQLLTWVCLLLWLVVTAVLTLPRLSLPIVRLHALLYLMLFGALVVLDQHRLQPWGVHIALCLVIATAFEIRQSLSWLLAFTASIYIYSAIGKLDAQFLHTVGQDFLHQLLQLKPGSYELLTDNARVALACLFPMGELLCGVGLLWKPSRQIALWLAVLMHLTLIAILGPWGLGHSWGVLLWNVVFIGLDVLMWLELRALPVDQPFRWQWLDRSDVGGRTKLYRLGVTCLCLGMLLVPLGERLEVVDHWLGWALYAPHSSRARIEVLSGSRDRLPASVQPYVNAHTGEIAVWDTVSVDRWSLASIGVPVYPQQRFYVAVARALAEHVDEFGIRVTLLGTASRWSGRRDQRVLESREELERASDRYWFNTQPRW